MKARTLALDLGTSCGWAMRTVDGSITSGTAVFRPGLYEGGGMRYLRFRGWLEEVHAAAGVDASHVYRWLLGILTSWAEHQAIPYAGVPVGTIKKHATGKGNADKAAMVEAMRARGFQPGDDNEADALALLSWAEANQPRGAAAADGPCPLPRAETLTRA